MTSTTSPRGTKSDGARGVARRSAPGATSSELLRCLSPPVWADPRGRVGRTSTGATGATGSGSTAPFNNNSKECETWSTR